eukprot:TRINITY_DN1132_c0_g1_i1.p1 TRINITY_DN1132_c0_g1~~TRINITY_DN1132_c0_g1_i1.p1  ORF type:complete len:176 (-),score=26.89 TRINITY_DN1132_c0_g1_i1:40-525(-)
MGLENGVWVGSFIFVIAFVYGVYVVNKPVTVGLEEGNQAVVRRFVDEMQNGFQSLDELVADDFKSHSPLTPSHSQDKASIPQLSAEMRAAFQDTGRVELIHIVASGDLVTTHKVFKGKHVGPGKILGQDPNNQTHHHRLMDVFRMRDGKIVEHWGTWSPII